MPIAQLPTFDAVTLGISSPDWRDVLREIFQPLRQLEGVLDPEQAWADLLARSLSSFSSLTSDIALPHARTAAVNRIFFAAGRHLNGISFGANLPPARIMFLVLTPKERPSEYLQLLASLSSRLRDPDTRARLLTAPTVHDFSAVLEGSAG